jgi:hypothetical protein
MYNQHALSGSVIFVGVLVVERGFTAFHISVLSFAGADGCTAGTASVEVGWSSATVGTVWGGVDFS